MSKEKERCPECRMLGQHKLQCSRREDGGQVRLPMKMVKRAVPHPEHPSGKDHFSVQVLSDPWCWVVVRFKLETMHEDMGTLITMLGADYGSKSPKMLRDDLFRMEFPFSDGNTHAGMFALEAWQALSRNMWCGDLDEELSFFRTHRTIWELGHELTYHEELKILRFLRDNPEKQWGKKGAVLIELQDTLGIGGGAILTLIEPSGGFEDYQYVVTIGGFRSGNPFTIDLPAVEARIALMEEQGPPDPWEESAD